MNDHRKIEIVPISNLKFDPKNPRLPSSLNQLCDEQSKIAWMIKNARLLELLDSIATQGFFDGEPLLVVKDENDYIVVEGNRRLAAVKLLNNRELSNRNKKRIDEIIDSAKEPLPLKLPVIVYAQRDEILEYLGYRHITGVQSWGALEKAKYLSQLRDYLIQNSPALQDQQNAQFIKLGSEIGTSSTYVGKLLSGLNLYQIIESHDFYGINGLNENSITKVS